MLSKLIEISLRNRVLVIALAALIIGWGAVVLKDTPIDAFPDLSENQVLVYADWMGRGPQEVQDQVTYPLRDGAAGTSQGERCSFGVLTRLFDGHRYF